MTASRPARRLSAALLLLLAASLVPAGAPALAVEPPAGRFAPAAATTPIPAPDAARRYRLNLASRSDYVQQVNFVQCVGASVQMMVNIVQPGADRSRTTQRRHQVTARLWSGPRPDGRERQGAGVGGWAAALNLGGAGPYRVVGADTLQEAMQLAAQAIRSYRRPVGLLVWQGRHAWVMSGFEATRDPVRGTFRVTGAYILDPLHPYGSKEWGPSPKPGTLVSVATVGRQFVPRRSLRSGSPWNRLPGMARLAGKYVLVVPTGPFRAGFD